ncbi:MAG: hypothetical protein ACT4P7_05360 [Gemmatimonadaceae bacterium]
MRSNLASRIRQILSTLVLTACATRPGGVAPSAVEPARPALSHAIIPAPVSAQIGSGESFVVDSATTVVIDAGASADVERIADMLAEMVSIRPASAQPRTPGVTGPHVARARRLAPGAPAPAKSKHLTVAPRRPALRGEG